MTALLSCLFLCHNNMYLVPSKHCALHVDQTVKRGRILMQGSVNEMTCNVFYINSAKLCLILCRIVEIQPLLVIYFWLGYLMFWNLKVVLMTSECVASVGNNRKETPMLFMSNETHWIRSFCHRWDKQQMPARRCIKNNSEGEKMEGKMLWKVLQKAWREGRKGSEAKTREGVLLMISPPAVGPGWSKRRKRRGKTEGGGGREEQWHRKQNGLWNHVDRRKISGGGRNIWVLFEACLQILMNL